MGDWRVASNAVPGAAAPVDADAPDLAATPDQRAARITSLDFIRGIAVIGILWANIVGYSRPGIAYRWASSFYDPDWGDSAVWLFQYVFIDGKLRGLFALLFGAGLVLFMDRARAKGAPARWLQWRRLFWLAVFGLAHYFLLFHGDILFHYAVLAMVAMWAVGWKPKILIALGALVYCVDSVFASMDLGSWVMFEKEALAAAPGSEVRTEYLAEASAMREEGRAERTLMLEGSFADIVAHRVTQQGLEPFTALRFMAFDSLPLMLIGAALYRLGLFSGGMERRKMIRWGSAGIALSALLSLILGSWVIWRGFPVAANFFAFYGPSHAIRLPMILGYAAVLAAVAPSLAPTAIGERISAAGRMAFSNYIGTSLVMAVIFQGWGLGLFDRFDRVGLLGFVAFGAALMLMWSKPWLARFRYGPLEWLWRCLTYWRLFPFRRAAPA